jgi:hypothetical protein
MAVGAVSAYAAIARFPINMLLIAALFTGVGMFSSATLAGLRYGSQAPADQPAGAAGGQRRHGPAVACFAVADPERDMAVNVRAAQAQRTPAARDPAAAAGLFAAAVKASFRRLQPRLGFAIVFIPVCIPADAPDHPQEQRDAAQARHLQMLQQ